MCKLQEKITFKELEENLRRKLRRQWLHLTGCRRNTIAPPIHKSWWGHQTRSWHRSGPPPTDDQLVPLLPEPDPPPLLPSLDNYTNKSVIITGQEGYWHVGPEVEASMEDLETSTASSVLEEEEVTRAEVYACDSDLDQQEEDFVSTEMAMIAHPPPFLTIHEYEDHDGENYDAFIDQEYEDYNAVECGESAGYQNQVEDPYATEFAAFYAAYEEGADHLYYRDDAEDDGRD